MKSSLTFGLVMAMAGLAVAAPAPPPPPPPPPPAASCPPPAPQTNVNLGYEIHQGNLNSTGGYYTFSNVPYAQPPVGNLRFQPPQPVGGVSNKLNTGSQGDAQCVQAYPQWIIDLQAGANGISSAQMADILYNMPGQTEDCLLLDVHVPASILAKGPRANAPVLVWIHGGGYTFGSKTSNGSPSGMINRAGLDNDEGIIIVTINYRLGTFGWLSGTDATANLGLFDQRQALKWVQQYITRFGGSPNRVTIMGESAGGSSITAHITANGGNDRPPFQAAIPQSPAFQYNIDTAASYKLTMQEASTVAGKTVANLNDLKTLSTDQIKAANQKVVQQAVYGAFNYGLVVDGSYVPALPQVLFAQGKFNKNLNIMVAHMPIESEAAPFTPQSIATEDDMRAYVKQVTRAPDATINEILTNVYPATFDGSLPYTTQFNRAVVFATELSFACTARFMSTGFQGKNYAYIFAYPPGFHAGDVNYEFFNGDMTPVNGVPVNVDIAHNLQDTLVNFAQTGNPSVKGLPVFPQYGAQANVLRFNEKGPIITTDDLKNPRCDWIQAAFVSGKLGNFPTTEKSPFTRM